MLSNKVSFLTIGRVYSLFYNMSDHKFSKDSYCHFSKILSTHLLNSLWAYCSVCAGIFERKTTVFKNDIAEMAVSEAASYFTITEKLYSAYSSFVKKNKEDKHDTIALALLSSGIDMSLSCEGAAILITESLQEQIDMINVDQMPKLVEHICKSILSNLGSKNIKDYIIADSSSPIISSSVFATACLFCTLIPSSVKKAKIGKYTTEGMLLRSGRKYSEKNSMICMGKKDTRLDKYRSREIYPDIWAFFIGLFSKEKYYVKETYIASTRLTEAPMPIGEIDHKPLGSKVNVEITDIPTSINKVNSGNLPSRENISLSRNGSMETIVINSSDDEEIDDQDKEDKKSKSYFCFPFVTLFYTILQTIIRRFDMGTKFSKSGNSTFFKRKDTTEGSKQKANEDQQSASQVTNISDNNSDLSKKKIENLPEYYPDDFEIKMVNIDEKYGTKEARDAQRQLLMRR